MDASVSAGEQHVLQEPRLRTARPSKACVPCRTRKVKCDAAVVGLPCSSCTSRQCTERCVLSARKRRTKRKEGVFSNPDESGQPRDDARGERRDAGHPDQSAAPQRQDTPDSLSCQSPRQSHPDLLYLNILRETVKEGAESSRQGTNSNTPHSSRPEDGLTHPNQLWNAPSQLDHIDNDYLTRKGVFELPPPRHLDALIKAYFDHVYPFAPIIDKAAFIDSYQSGDCSLFLLRAMLTAASLYAPDDVIRGCNFESRSAAQESFFVKTKLLHDFNCESNPLFMLQGSMILGVIILDRPSDRDFDYWFHNSIRLAAKLDIRNTCIREDESCTFLKLYRRIWWGLYCWDIFHIFLDTGYSRLLERVARIKPLTEIDWEAESFPPSFDLLSPITPQQKASFIGHSELSQIFGECLSTVKNESYQDPRQLMKPLDTWRKSLARKMHIDDDVSHGTDIYYIDVLATSYRFESILCRLLSRRRRWQSQHAEWSDWAKKRLRSSIIELDTIAKRVLANGTIREFPMSFVTTMPALLALHIESALDPAETDLARSMARISIHQTMLVLSEGQEIPALKRALPVFEDILSKKDLYSISPSNADHISAQSHDTNMVNTYASPYTQASAGISQLVPSANPANYSDFLGFDFLDEWQIEQLDFMGRY